MMSTEALAAGGAIAAGGGVATLQSIGAAGLGAGGIAASCGVGTLVGGTLAGATVGGVHYLRGKEEVAGKGTKTVEGSKDEGEVAFNSVVFRPFCSWREWGTRTLQKGGRKVRV